MVVGLPPLAGLRCRMPRILVPHFHAPLLGSIKEGLPGPIAPVSWRLHVASGSPHLNVDRRKRSQAVIGFQVQRKPVRHCGSWREQNVRRPQRMERIAVGLFFLICLAEG